MDPRDEIRPGAHDAPAHVPGDDADLEALDAQLRAEAEVLRDAPHPSLWPRVEEALPPRAAPPPAESPTGAPKATPRLLPWLAAAAAALWLLVHVTGEGAPLEDAPTSPAAPVVAETGTDTWLPVDPAAVAAPGAGAVATDAPAGDVLPRLPAVLSRADALRTLTDGLGDSLGEALVSRRLEQPLLDEMEGLERDARRAAALLLTPVVRALADRGLGGDAPAGSVGL